MNLVISKEDRHRLQKMLIAFYRQGMSDQVLHTAPHIGVDSLGRKRRQIKMSPGKIHRIGEVGTAIHESSIEIEHDQIHRLFHLLGFKLKLNGKSTRLGACDSNDSLRKAAGLCNLSATVQAVRALARRLSMKQKQRYLVMLIAMAFASLSPQKVPAADKLNTAYISTTPGSSAVLWVAKDTKIFDKHGIDATIIFISGSVRGIQSILAGEIAIGEGGGPGLASARLAGGDVIAIAGNVNVLPYYLVSQPSIKKHEDLRGKVGGTHIAGTTAEFALKVGLKRIGLDPLKDVNLRVIGGAIERMVALQKGIVNFTVVTEAGKAIAEKLGYPTVVDMAALQIPFPQNGVYTSTKLIREN